MKEELLITAGKFVMGYYARIFLDFDLLKLEEFPIGAKLFVSNHPTTTDPFLIGLLTKEPMRIMVTGGAYKVPVFKEYLMNSGHIPIIRGEGKGDQIINNAVCHLNDGKVVCIFPEGALSPEEKDGFGVSPAHSGVARIALASGAPVIPVGIAVDKSGIISVTKEFSFTDAPATGRWAGRGSYAITVGRPLIFNGDPKNHSLVKEIGQKITEEIRTLSIVSHNRINSHHIQWASLISLRNLFIPLLKLLSS